MSMQQDTTIAAEQKTRNSTLLQVNMFLDILSTCAWPERKMYMQYTYIALAQACHENVELWNLQFNSADHLQKDQIWHAL